MSQSCRPDDTPAWLILRRLCAESWLVATWPFTPSEPVTYGAKRVSPFHAAAILKHLLLDTSNHSIDRMPTAPLMSNVMRHALNQTPSAHTTSADPAACRQIGKSTGTSSTARPIIQITEPAALDATHRANLSLSMCFIANSPICQPTNPAFLRFCQPDA